MQIVEGVEDGHLPARPALRYLLSQLLNSAAEFHALAQETLNGMTNAIAAGRFDDPADAIRLFEAHMGASQYAARIMEISMHALMQSIAALGGLGDGALERLSQMRSANKKHGNIGDIEIKEGAAIVTSWDAKYVRAICGTRSTNFRTRSSIIHRYGKWVL